MATLQSMDIRSLRTEMGIKQRDLAKKAQVSPSDLSKCERGLVPPDMRLITAVSKILSANPGTILKAHKMMLDNPISGEGYVTKKTSEFFTIKRIKTPNKEAIPILDLFCGTGGFSNGFEQTEKFQVVSGLDMMSDRIHTFSHNHPAAKAYCHDITRFSIDKFNDDVIPQVIIGGPPCQGFSSIRPFRSVNENDPRNNLFTNFAFAVKKLRPEWFVLENVVGLATHQKGKTVTKLQTMFEKMGYTVSWSILNAVHFGLPQRRERFIMVGNIDGHNFEFPMPTHHFNGKSMAKSNISYTNVVQGLKPAVTVMDAIGDLPNVDAGGSVSRYNSPLTPYQKSMRRDETDLKMHSATAHTQRMLKIITHSGSNRHSIPKEMVSSGFSSSYSRLDPDEPSVTITVNFGFPGSNKCIHPYQNRALTPREAARLQGFHDMYEFVGTRSEICKQIGNAVPPILGRVIGEALFRQMRT